MLAHSARIALRALRRGGSQSIINILGLSVGLAVCLLIVLYIRSETGYDAHLENGDRLYRVSVLEQDESGSTTIERVNLSPAIATALREHFPQVETAARLMPVGPSLSYGDQTIYPDHTYWSDPETVDLLELDLILGDGRMDSPHSVLLSESTARRLAGRTDLTGKTVVIADESFVVTGIFRDTPLKSHVHVDAIAPLDILTRWFGTEPDNVWDSPNYATYVRLAPGVSLGDLESQLAGFFERYGGSRSTRNGTLRFQNVREIHLASDAVSEFEPQGSRRTVALMALIAAIVLAIACANFINLSTARAARRSKEVGMRKVVGATRTQLALQFTGEAVGATMISLFVGALFAEVAAPRFGDFTGKTLSLFAAESVGLIPWLLLAGLILGVLAGLYPALVLSSFRPTAIFGRSASPRTRSFFRSLLVAGQFALAAALIVSTLVILRQLRFAQTEDPGFDSEQIMLLPGMRTVADDFEPVRERMMAHPDVLDVTHTWRAPMQPLLMASEIEAEVDDDLRSIQVFTMFADDHYYSTFGIPILAGRGFDPARDTELESTFVLNETAVERLGFRSPEAAIGVTLRYGGRTGTVVGVAADYHQESFHKPIVPMIIWPYPQNYRTVAVRFRSDDIPSLAAFLREAWQAVEGDSPISVDFLDDRFEAVYAQERRLARAFGVFAGLGVFVACLGLFGIAAATMERRVREIGVRKVLGASTGRLTARMTVDFLLLVVAGFALGAALAWIAMNRWLADFAYHDGVGASPILFALLFVVSVAVIAVSLETWRAARVNPVESLRHA